ncbi:hydroxymethylpyrimidine pyrophosphatase-like HAD family hydrolase [Labedella gwakjiensis]|uniref:Hydroxymethylpyrimidine pyrophosphatase-like HAD family hydrolase n=2 Tax=Labedella gwakjiensis TaxID=390269 RepID=A0A2P8GS68_9MICO|nr:hydroxymethylpyrimidine pyrophosphatase-like HAD family hydrolase [Labedella gwakjiensis]RUQ84420.1 hypothetical protein ELQ93_16010 [Labedella gwakjiensis]
MPPLPAETRGGTRPPVALLLDVDGPIASPDTRTIRLESIARDLAALANSGALVVFNTGRAAAFISEVVVPVVRAAGLESGHRLWAVCEKGAVWFGFDADSQDEAEVDEALAMDPSLERWVELRVAEHYADTMFFDRHKLAMISVEQIVDAARADYHAAQALFDEDVFRRVLESGGGVERREVVDVGRAGTVTVRIDPTIISTDIEHPALGKDLGAQRAILLAREHGLEIPAVWRTMGDSRTDYAMADWLHANGYSVAHVDVRPADGVPETQYPVLVADGDLVHDDAAAVFLERWRRITDADGWGADGVPDGQAAASA